MVRIGARTRSRKMTAWKELVIEYRNTLVVDGVIVDPDKWIIRDIEEIMLEDGLPIVGAWKHLVRNLIEKYGKDGKLGLLEENCVE